MFSMKNCYLKDTQYDYGQEKVNMSESMNIFFIDTVIQFDWTSGSLSK